MKKENLPICSEDISVKDLIHKITDGKSGLIVVLKNNKIQGIITDGDIRRSMEENEDKFFKLTAKDLMSSKPKTIHFNEKLVKAGDMMSELKINSLIVVNDTEELVGIVQMYDLGI
jgi:arabinose-5-phosphate isomerase